jgi:hypothetical protein
MSKFRIFAVERILFMSIPPNIMFHFIALVRDASRGVEKDAEVTATSADFEELTMSGILVS